MIVVIAGVHGGADLSTQVQRDGTFEVDSALGKRMDTLRMVLDDSALDIAVPTRSEVIVYDLAPGATIVDPPSPNPSPRLFGGYAAGALYSLVGGQRYVEVEAQDYTIRLKTTIVNKAYGIDATHPNGWSDAQIIADLFQTYRPDIDAVSQVQTTVNPMPPISFPVHTLEQAMDRISKISGAAYRVDYYRRLNYGLIGSVAAPFSVADVPNETASPPVYGAEGLTFHPQFDSMFGRVWVLGAQQIGATQTITIDPKPDSSAAVAFALPVPVDRVDQAVVAIAGGPSYAAGQVGTLGRDGTLDNSAQWSKPVLIGSNPPTVAFQTPPGAGATITVTAQFRYPVIAVVTDQTVINQSNGLAFESLLRDRRINSQQLAVQAGQQHIKMQGYAVNGGSFTCRKRGVGTALLQPGHTIPITHARLFAAGVLPGGGTTATVLVNRIRLSLTDDTVDPYYVTVDYADRQLYGT